jgi:hypothetical protein
LVRTGERDDPALRQPPLDERAQELDDPAL